MDQNQYYVEVVDPVVKDGLQKYVVYNVRGMDKSGMFDSLKRYSDFSLLRELLVERWPGVYIPPLPPKKSVGNLEPAFIEGRRRFLDLFLKALMQVEAVWESVEVSTFLKSNDAEKALSQLPRLTWNDILYKYQTQFPDASTIDKAEATQQAVKFYTFLQTSDQQLESYKQQAQTLQDRQVEESKQMVFFVDYLMPEYERNCLSSYNDQSQAQLLFQQGEGDALKLKYINTINQVDFTSLLDRIKIEQREVQAMQEAMNQKAKYEKQRQELQVKMLEKQQEIESIQAGKTTMKSFLSKNSKEEQVTKLNADIEKIKEQIEGVNTLIDIILYIIVEKEIHKFKSSKEQSYFNLLKRISEMQIQASRAVSKQSILKTQEFFTYLAGNETLQQI